VRLITAVIRPGQLDTVHRALGAFGVSGLTATEVFVESRWNRHLEVYRAQVMVATSVARVRIEVLADDADCIDLAELLIRVCNTERGGDDTFTVWISNVEQVVHVRTGEHS